MTNERDKEIQKLQKELKFAKDQLAKTLKLYDQAKEETTKAVEARSEFLSKLSHEAKTPMNALIGYSELINQEDVSGEFFEFSMGIKSATNRLLNFFNDLIEMSRIESGLTTLLEDEYVTADALKSVVNNVRYEIESKGIEFRLNVSENVPTVMYGDKMHITQIVINLLTNAIKFTEKGYIALELETKQTDKMGHNGKPIVEVHISVTDTGVGIKKADRERLFDSFIQFNSSSPYSSQGVGLGLAICKHFSNLMGGDILFESRYGKGSKFTCKILQEVVDEAPLDKKYVEDYVYNSNMKLSAPDAKVLLVDDSKVNLSVSSGLLLWFDIEADTAGGGIEAVEKASKTKYDVIFMDHMMPDMDGVEATKHIRQMGGHNEEVPIVALTANTTDEARTMFRNNGFTDFLAKPVEIDAFKAVLERQLPFEKIIRDVKSNAEKQAEKNKDIIDKELFENNGILVNKGLVFFAGKISAYVETLKMIYSEGVNNIEKLKSFLNDEDIRNYEILAHSIKSVMASIGAVALSEKAKEHEFAGKEGNIDFIRKNGEDFINDYSIIIKFIGDNIEVGEVDSEETDDTTISDSKMSVSEIKKVINAAIEDIDDFESDAAIEKLNMLKNNL